MIISRTPFRISFFGGGTDYPEWVSRHGGAVLSTTFDKYCYITCRHLPPFFEHKYRIAYSKVENTNSVDEIEHRAVRAVLRELDIDEGLEIHCDADLPARSGLGSSSSFVVGMLNAVTALQGRRASKEWLIAEATRIEQKVLNETVGYQDQAASASGGLNVIQFERDGTVSVDPVVVSLERKELLNEHLMLCFTGFSRTASDVAAAQVANIKKSEGDLHQMRAMVDDAVRILCGTSNIESFGALLHDAWERKRRLSDRVTSASIDEIYSRARAAGAIGGKLLGAGGGGFMLLFVKPDRQDAVRKALGELIHVPFRFETSGSRIIYYQP